MKIQTDVLADSSSVSSTRPEHAPRTPGSRGGISGPGGGFDQVELSSTAERITEAASTEDLRASERVRELAELYNSGQYRVEAEQLSRALIASALKNSSEDRL